MKKITRTLLGVVVLLSSCTKEPNFARNYSQPIDVNDPCGYQSGSSISWEEGMCEDRGDCFAVIDPVVYDLSEVEENRSVNSPNPNYMLFPHVFNSTASEWNWNYLKEMKSLKKEHGNEGIQMFLDKYLEGDSTLGMKLENLQWN